MKKLLALVLALSMCLCAVSAFAEEESDLAYVLAKGTLVVGITDFAPMDYLSEDGTTWIGFDADLATAFAEALGVEVEFVEIDWDNKILELNAKTVDCIWNGMTLTDEVAAAMSCTDAYLENSQVIVLPSAKVAEVSGYMEAGDNEGFLEAMKGLTFAVEAGSAGEEQAAEYGLNTTPVNTQSSALMEVAAGTSDGAIIDLLMAEAMTGEGTGYEDLSAVFSLNAEVYVIGFRQGSDLTEGANAFLADCAENGVIAGLTALYITGVTE